MTLWNFPTWISDATHVICRCGCTSSARSHTRSGKPGTRWTIQHIRNRTNGSIALLNQKNCILQPRPILAPNPRVIQHAPPPRENNENVAPPGVMTTTAPSSIAPKNQEPLPNGRLQKTPPQHHYPIWNKIHAHHVTTATPDNSQLTLYKFLKTIIIIKYDYHIFHNYKNDIVTILPCVNHVICKGTI